jgi:hypothetical protein
MIRYAQSGFCLMAQSATKYIVALTRSRTACRVTLWPLLSPARCHHATHSASQLLAEIHMCLITRGVKNQ